MLVFSLLFAYKPTVALLLFVSGCSFTFAGVATHELLGMVKK